MSEKYKTEIISIDEVGQIFNKTKAWKKRWPNLERLLWTNPFKSIVSEEQLVKEGLESEIGFTSKLEFAALGLVWCEGKLEDKANFLFELINPEQDEMVSKNNNNLKFVV